MTKLFALALAAVPSAAFAQTPTTNPMPDGSRDMYVGLGIASGARYQGAADTERRVLPVLQVQLSNGVFVSGMRAGIHLGRSLRIEFGPLLEWQPRRDAVGEGDALGGVGDMRLSMAAMPLADAGDHRPAGMPVIHGRLQGGGFLNYYTTADWRLSASLLYGAGNARDGAKLDLGVQRLALALGAHHRLAFDAGLGFANGRYNRAFFGIGEDDSLRGGLPAFDAGGGLKDARIGARWNWAWSPSWMLTSHVQATRLLGSARLSPLVERPTNLTVSTAIAYRF